MLAISKEISPTREEQLSIIPMIILHLLPSAIAMTLMLIASPPLGRIGPQPSVPVLFIFVTPILILIEMGFLYYQGWQVNGKLSLRDIVLYRDEPITWWKTIAFAIPLLAWIAFIWFVIKQPVNSYFIQHVFHWMPANFLDEYFLENLNQYSPSFLRVLGILFTVSITLGGIVEEPYFRDYLLPRMEYLGVWAPLTNIVLFSLYHFWSPWENVVRVLALTPWIVAVWRTRNIYLALLIHFTINAFAGISLFRLILRMT